MPGDLEQAAEAIASEITDAIEGANEHADASAAVATAIADAALEGERGRKIETIERDLSECLSNQAALSEAMTTFATAQAEMQGALSTLLALQPLPTLPTPDQSDAAAGLPASPDPEPAAAPQPEPPPPTNPEAPANRAKKKRWI